MRVDSVHPALLALQQPTSHVPIHPSFCSLALSSRGRCGCGSTCTAQNPRQHPPKFSTQSSTPEVDASGAEVCSNVFRLCQLRGESPRHDKWPPKPPRMALKMKGGLTRRRCACSCRPTSWFRGASAPRGLRKRRRCCCQIQAGGDDEDDEKGEGSCGGGGGGGYAHGMAHT
eukprot:1528773-Rhodomonas_salina.2